ncbi:hypothetical protein PV08_11969 [Exophiala spinifera]|uniref:MACPF domain-containing protein n=1 Tax=Exophiala spinifera TaxID=91928 RepID=A0A0D2AT16_9EURO|nr:uncharacterized protein PV08_11969 [Exophiala spinifera]KIW09868.1 hypothetical protein PV08_11969 [Exophiala spinifera]
MNQCETVPWGGFPLCHGEDFDKFPVAPLFMPFHSTVPDDAQVHADLDGLATVTDWRHALKTRRHGCQCPFWGPSAFATDNLHPDTHVVLEPLQRTTYARSISPVLSSNSSHFSAQLGGGVGNEYLSVTVSGKYDRVVADTQKTCRDSTTVHTITGQLGISRLPVLTKEAITLLQEEGPDMFEIIYGSHFVWKIIAGAEAGFCLAMTSMSHTERESLSIVAEIDLFFFSTSAEAEILSKYESSFTEDLKCTFYDTLEHDFSTKTGLELKKGLGDYARMIRDKVGRIEKRVAERIHPIISSPAVSLRSKEMSDCMIAVLVAPWSILLEWHESANKWKAKTQYREC